MKYFFCLILFLATSMYANAGNTIPTLAGYVRALSIELEKSDRYKNFGATLLDHLAGSNDLDEIEITSNSWIQMHKAIHEIRTKTKDELRTEDNRRKVHYQFSEFMLQICEHQVVEIDHVYYVTWKWKLK